MPNLKLFAITNVLWVLMIGAPQINSFEKQALSLVQAMPASDLDAKLPGRPFASWFEQVIGPEAGVVWQLTDCGERIVAPGETGQDLSACAEIDAVLPDKRRVFIRISVGTFKKGLTGKPAFFGAVIEQNAGLYRVPRLYDLPEMLRAPDRAPDGLSNKRPATKTKNRIVNLPKINVSPVKIVMLSHDPSPSSNVPGAPVQVE